ncbi:hypothetical protein [Granulicella sp. S156]|uniref:hypothetical protein n=1 Tax=Granulicella sp. S156 TaxID=1747224 RepID=UPI00131AEB6F|nr:hypothetical protein [Granulicella sp. S156]
MPQTPIYPAPRYRSVEFREVAHANGLSFLVRPGTDQWFNLSDEQFELLRQCQDFRTLEEHAHAMTGDIPLARFHRKRLLSRLQELAGQQALVEENAFLQSVPSGEDTGAKIRFFGMLTRHRTEKMRDTLRACLARNAKSGREIKSVVIDDSTDATTIDNNRETLAALAEEWDCPILYCGSEEREHFARKLADATGVDLPLIRFAIAPYSAEGTESMGAARNVLLLQSAGALGFSSDDDLGERLALPQHEKNLRISSEGVLEMRFFENRAAALQHLQGAEEDLDLFACHEKLLGKNTARLITEEGPESVSVGAIPWPGLRRCLQGKVGITLSGLFGDSATPGPIGYLMPGGRTRASLIEGGEKAYRMKLETREVIRSVAQPSITPQFDFWAGSHGFDHRTLLPPFVPWNRAEDTVMGSILTHCCAPLVCGYVPALALHNPPETRAFPSNWRSTYGVMSVNECLVTFLLNYKSPPGLSVEASLRQFGLYLQEIGSMPFADFAATLEFYHRENLCVQIALFHSYLAGNLPDYWKEDIAAIARTMEQRLQSPHPLEVRLNPYQPMPEGKSGLQRAHELALRFGQLLEAWPALVQAAGQMPEDERAGRPIRERSVVSSVGVS